MPIRFHLPERAAGDGLGGCAFRTCCATSCGGIPTGSLCLWRSVPESYQALSVGLQNALWKLGRVSEEHRTDNLTAATFRGSSRTRTGMWNNRNTVSSSGWIKSCCCGAAGTLPSGANEHFLEQVFDLKNQSRQQRLEEELAVMRPLPAKRLEDWREYKVRVTSWMTVTVAHNTYPVPSWLSRYEVLARLHADRVEIYFVGQCAAEMERLQGGVRPGVWQSRHGQDSSVVWHCA